MHHLSRVIRSVVILSMLAAVNVSAQPAYPSQPIRLVVPTIPGALDAFARTVAEKLAVQLGQPVVVENKPGAAGNLGAAYVAQAKPDGHTLLLSMDTTLTVNPHLYPDAAEQFLDKLDPIAVPVTYSQMLAVHPDVPAQDLAGFVAWGKDHAVNYGSGGIGAPGHLTFAALQARTGLDALHVPYKGSAQALTDTLGGTLNAVFVVTAGVLPHAEKGALRPIAISSAQRSALAPDVPTVAESGYPGFDVRFAYVLSAPKGTPAAVLQRLQQELSIALQQPDVQQKLQAWDYAATRFDAPQSQQWVRDQRAYWQDIVARQHITLDERAQQPKETK